MADINGYKSIGNDTPQYEEVQVTIEHFKESNGQRRNWILWAVLVTIVLLLVLIGINVYRYYEATTIPDLPVSTTNEENIAKLNASHSSQGHHHDSDVVMTTDSINEVPFELYKLENLRAELTYDRPSEEDSSVYLCTLSADVRADNGKVLGDCVIKGKEQSQGRLRTGYFAALGNNVVIGVSPDEDVRDVCVKKKGFFFRQFAIVSAGQVGDTRLKGKTHRKALARMSNDELYFIQSLNRESLYDFAEAIADYGFTDAIYLTGGNTAGFCRDRSGAVQKMGVNEDVENKYNQPYLVFKKMI